MLRESSRYTTALAELPTAGNINSNRSLMAGRPPAGAWRPTLWKEWQSLKFVPFVIEEPEARAKAKDDTAEFEKLLRGGLKKIQPQIQAPDLESSRFRAAFPVAKDAMKSRLKGEPTEPTWQPDSGLRARIGRDKRIVILAIIDDGVPFAHRNFRDASGRRTRIEFCWLQSARSIERQTSVLFGREYTRNDIERDIARFGDDEDVLYREAGATDDTEGLASTLRRHTAHGGHMLDLATGYAPERGEEPAEEIRIIAVQLPNVVTLDTSGFGKDMYLLSAFHYIFNRADLIEEKYGIGNARLVINFSYGYSGGRHDGQVGVEEAIDELVKARRRTKRPTALVLPAGNTFLDRMHVRIPEARFAKHHGKAEFQWRLQPNDRTPSYLEIWFPEDFEPEGYKITVRDPRGVRRGSLRVQAFRSKVAEDRKLLNGDGDQVGQISEDYRVGRWGVLIVTAPSEPENSSLPAIDAGAWTIVITRRGAKALPEPIRCWIQRDTDPASLRSGARQSYFDDPQDERYDWDGSLREVDTVPALLRRFGSLNSLSAIRTSLVVAGFRLGAGLGSSLEEAKPARYSCAGTQNAGWPEARVACSSMSDRSQVLAGTVAAGVRSGSRSFLQGTSAAAPFVARQLAAAFVRESDDVVEAARKNHENYRPLLSGYRLGRKQKQKKKRHSLEKDRLGLVLVRPHWQPGVEKPE